MFMNILIILKYTVQESEKDTPHSLIKIKLVFKYTSGAMVK